MVNGSAMFEQFKEPPK